MKSPSFFASVSSAIVLIGLLASCAPNIDMRGNAPDPDRLAELKRGYSSKNQVLDALGTPSSTSAFGTETWYYISAKTRTYAFFSPEVLERKIVAISFDQSGRITDIQEESGEGVKDVSPVKRQTPSAGKDLGLVEQLLGNIGRFSKDKAPQ